MWLKIPENCTTAGIKDLEMDKENYIKIFSDSDYSDNDFEGFENERKKFEIGVAKCS